MNKKLFSILGILSLLFIVCSAVGFSAIYTTTTTTLPVVAANNVQMGVRFVTNIDNVIFKNATTQSGDDHVLCYVYNLSGSVLLGSGTIASNTCTLSTNLNLRTGTTYVLQTEAKSTGTIGQKTSPSYPYTGVGVNITSGAYNIATNDPGSVWSFTSITIDTNVSPNNFTITAKDNITNQTISNFTAIVNGITYNTTLGSITTQINSSILANITITSDERNSYSIEYTNYNTSTNLAASINPIFSTPTIPQNYWIHCPFQEITGNRFSCLNNTATNLWNGYFSLLGIATNYNSTFNKPIMSFNSTTGYIGNNWDSFSNIYNGAQSRTYHFWIYYKNSTFPNSGELFSHEHSISDAIYRMTAQTNAFFITRQYSSVNYPLYAYLNDSFYKQNMYNKWVLMSWSINNTNCKSSFYINGNLINSTTLSACGVGGTISDQLQIGQQLYNDNSNSQLSSFTIYPFEMTAQQVNDFYAMRVDPKITTPLPNNNKLNIVGQNTYTKNYLTPINLVLNSTLSTTNNNVLYTNYYSGNDFYINSTTAFNNYYTNYNATNILYADFSQSVINFIGREKYTNNTIATANFTTPYLANTTHYMAVDTYNVTSSAPGYFNTTSSITVSALETSTRYIYLAPNRLNLTVRNNLSGGLVNSYTATITNLANPSYTETLSTTNGTLLFDVIAGNWSVFINATGYAHTYANVTVAAATTNATIYAFTQESVLFRFFNEQTNQLITSQVSLDMIGDYASYNRTTTNGTIYIDLITPSAYEIRYRATGYTNRFGYVTVTEKSSQIMDLYLLNSSATANVTITVLTSAGQKVESALIKMLKYDLATNAYTVKEQTLTNYLGTAQVSVQLNSEYYKFIVEYPSGTVALTTDPFYITSTALTLVLEGSTGGTEYVQINNANGNVEFNYNTNNFRFDWSDSTNSVTQACLYVYKLEANYTGTFYNSSCVSSSSGSLLVPVLNISGYRYYAKGIFVFSGTTVVADTEYAQFTSTAWGNLGLLIAVVLVVAITFMFLKSPQAAVIAAPIGLVLTNQVGITNFQPWVPFGFVLIAIIILYIMGRSK